MLLVINIITWIIWGKDKIFDKEYSFVIQNEYYRNDDNKIYLHNLKYSYFEGYNLFDSLYISNQLNKKVDMEMEEKNYDKPFIHFKIPWYNPFFIKSTVGYWILGTDGFFKFHSNYVWIFFDWIKIFDTEYDY